MRAVRRRTARESYRRFLSELTAAGELVDAIGAQQYVQMAGQATEGVALGTVVMLPIYCSTAARNLAIASSH